MPAQRIALIAGATGLAGRHLLEILLSDLRYSTVHTLVRRTCRIAAAKIEEHVVDFERLPALPDTDDVYCCLGTTIRKAGSQAAFRKVDFDYVVDLATAARQSGVSRFLVVSAMGANAESAVFYNRIKGEMEQALVRIGFQALYIFQPSLLLGERHEARRGERAGIAMLSALAPLMLGPARKYRPIDAGMVARAMVVAAWTAAPGTIRFPSDQIALLGERTE